MSKSAEDRVLDEVLENEGGYQRMPEDRGNKNSRGQLVGTNFGISAPVYERVLGRPPSAQDMKDMTEEEARDIYRDQYIRPVKENLGVPSDHPAFPQIVDMAVNHGYSGATAIIQRALGAKVDGKAGPETRKKLEDANPVELNNSLVDERVSEYRTTVQQDDSQARFLDGWVNRAERYRIGDEAADEPQQFTDSPTIPTPPPAKQPTMNGILDTGMPASPQQAAPLGQAPGAGMLMTPRGDVINPIDPDPMPQRFSF
jgi:lysozyme family protein